MEFTDLAYIDATGYHFADFPAFLALAQEKMRSIYGADIYLGPDSQDGQLVSVWAKSQYDCAALGAAVYNSFSPVTAQGVGLSRVVKINGLTRRTATRSSADLTIVGQSGTNIVNGVAIDTLNQRWNLPPSVLIPMGGSIVVTAIAQDEGAVQAEASTINRIYTPTLGWQTVNNVASATAGQAAETDAELRVRQGLSTANPSLTVFDGTVGGVANLAGVTAVRGYENDTGSTDGNSIPAHSICVVVQGGDSTEICQEILLHKTPGCGTHGNTNEIVYDAHGMPSDIHFQRVDEVTIKAEITISAGPQWSADYEALIKAAVAETIIAGGIGNTVVLSKLYPSAYLNGSAPGQTYSISSIEIAEGSDPLAGTNIPLNFDQIPICDPAVNVTVVVT